MANQSQLNIIYQGVFSWNHWRHNNLTAPVDLSGADLSKRDLSGIRLDGVDLSGANLQETDLKGAVLVCSNIQHVNLTSANLNSIRLSQANLANSRFVNVDTRNSDLSGVNLDQSYIEEFRGHFASRSEPLFNDPLKFSSTLFQIKRYFKFFPSIIRNPKFWFIYLPWLVLSDCGRSFSLWFSWSLIIAMFFGAVYAGYPAPEWLPETIRNVLYDVAPAIELSRDKTSFTSYYFSIVTFTTLGFGDVLPKNLAGEIWLTIEVIIGYIMLGGLISIFSNKLARRGA